MGGSKHDEEMCTVAVLAFKAVYTLEMTRRQNDKRVLALYAECVVHLLSGAHLVSPMPG